MSREALARAQAAFVLRVTTPDPADRDAGRGAIRCVLLAKRRKAVVHYYPDLAREFSKQLAVHFKAWSALVPWAEGRTPRADATAFVRHVAADAALPMPLRAAAVQALWNRGAGPRLTMLRGASGELALVVARGTGKPWTLLLAVPRLAGFHTPEKNIVRR